MRWSPAIPMGTVLEEGEGGGCVQGVGFDGGKRLEGGGGGEGGKHSARNM